MTEGDFFFFMLHQVGTLQLNSIEAEGTIVMRKLQGSLGLQWQQIQVSSMFVLFS